MDTPDTPRPLVLLGLFAEFHDEVAQLRREAAAGTLARYLAATGGAVPATPEEQARAASARLANLLRALHRRMRSQATEAQARTCGTASYVMAALADEIFIELDWPGRRPWLSCLVEHEVFGTRTAGTSFFDRAEEVLAAPVRDPLHCDLASCFLLALQLGFKGVHRSAAAAPQLEALRARLWRFVHGSADRAWPASLFPQAGEHTVISPHDARIAPIAPWLRAARWWAVGFLVLSSVLWLALVQPLLRLQGL